MLVVQPENWSNKRGCLRLSTGSEQDSFVVMYPMLNLRGAHVSENRRNKHTRIWTMWNFIELYKVGGKKNKVQRMTYFSVVISPAAPLVKPEHIYPLSVYEATAASQATNLLSSIDTKSHIFAELHSTKAYYGAASCFVTAMPLWRRVSNLTRDGAVGHIFCFSPVSLHGFSSPTNLAVGSVHYTVLYSPSIRTSLPLDWRSHQNPREKSWTFTGHDGDEKEDPTGAKKQDTVWCESCFF